MEAQNLNSRKEFTMKINRNMSAVMTNKNLLRTENKLSASMERLSSGFKINRAGDNPAGLAISHKMKAQIDGLDRAKSNTTDAQSLLRIADGALNETASILQRIRELCVQAANDTNSIDERNAIQDEIDKLTEEVDRISTDTEYNTKALLDGSSDILVMSKQTERMYVSDSVLPGDYSMSVTQQAQKALYEIPSLAANEGVMSINGVEMEITAGMNQDEFFELLRDTAERAGCVATKDILTNRYNLVTDEYGQSAEIEIKVVKRYMGFDSQQEEEEYGRKMDALAATLGLAVETRDDEGNPVVYSAKEKGVDAEVELDTASKFSDTATAHVDGLHVKVTDLDGFCMDFSIREDVNDVPPGVYNVDVKVTDIGAMTIQMGANQYQDMDIRIPQVSAKSMYLDKVDVTITGGPDKALVTLDNAVDRLNEVRARIGAFTNRLEYAERSLAETHEDMTSAYSTILDTDMAEEMVEYTQRNVLEQASISVLAQANDLPQQVLSLLQ